MCPKQESSSDWRLRYIKGFATIAEPLHRLTDKETEFSWDSHTQQAFEKLKTALSSSPILACPDFSKDFVVFTDASDTGLGAVVSSSSIAKAIRTVTQMHCRGAHQRFYLFAQPLDSTMSPYKQTSVITNRLTKSLLKS